MEDYMSTGEVARYLKINQKKVYELIAKGLIPATRVSGKWLFPRRLVDQWLEGSTVNPAGGLVSSLLEHMIIMQGSDDPLLSTLVDRYQGKAKAPVLSSRVGSRAGLDAVGEGMAHAACCHVEDACVERALHRTKGYWLIDLFSRDQGIVFDKGRLHGAASVEEIVARRPRLAMRQEASGTFALTKALLKKHGADAVAIETAGPFFSHAEVALAVRSGPADAGVGIRWAAATYGLDFLPLAVERFRLAVPVALVSHPAMGRFLDFLFSSLRDRDEPGFPGYGFAETGRIRTIRS